MKLFEIIKLMFNTYTTKHLNFFLTIVADTDAGYQAFKRFIEVYGTHYIYR